MVTSTYEGKPRIFGKPGKRSVLLDDAANIGMVVDLLKDRLRAGELLRLGVSRLDGSDLAFLRELPFLQYLRVDRCYGSTIASAQACHELRWLFLSEDYGALDLRTLPRLEQLTIGQWTDAVCGLEGLSNLLRLEGHNVKAESIEKLALPSSLMELKLLETELQSLQGIGSSARLESVEIGYSPGIQSLAGIDRLPGLRRLYLKRLKRLGDYGRLDACWKLCEIEISDCSPIASIAWVRNLAALRFFVLSNTDVLDGDLSVLVDHKGLLWGGGTNKRHFRPSMKNLEESLRARRLALGFDTVAEASKKGLLPEGISIGGARGGSWVA